MVSVKSNIGRSAYGIIVEDDKNSHNLNQGEIKMDTIGDAIMRHLAAITNPGAILDKGNNPLGKDDLISLANSDYAYVRCNGKFLMSCELGSWLVYDMSKFSDEDIDILTGDDVSDPCLFDNDLQGRVERNHGIFVMQLANLHE